jgi:hypothetical protein
MANAIFSLDPPANEPVLQYRPGSDEAGVDYNASLQRLKSTELEIPLIIGGSPVKTGKLGRCIIPSRPWPPAGRISPGRQKRGGHGHRGSRIGRQ